MRTVQTQNFIKILRAVFKIWTKNIKNAPKMGFFPHLRPPKIFFKNRALLLLCPYSVLTSCKKFEKSLERSLRYLKKDQLTGEPTDGQGRLLRTHSGKPGVQNKIFIQSYLMHLNTKLAVYSLGGSSRYPYLLKKQH